MDSHNPRYRFPRNASTAHDAEPVWILRVPWPRNALGPIEATPFPLAAALAWAARNVTPPRGRRLVGARRGAAELHLEWQREDAGLYGLTAPDAPSFVACGGPRFVLHYQKRSPRTEVTRALRRPPVSTEAFLALTRTWRLDGASGAPAEGDLLFLSQDGAALSLFFYRLTPYGWVRADNPWNGTFFVRIRRRGLPDHHEYDNHHTLASALVSAARFREELGDEIARGEASVAVFDRNTYHPHARSLEPQDGVMP